MMIKQTFKSKPLNV